MAEGSRYDPRNTSRQDDRRRRPGGSQGGRAQGSGPGGGDRSRAAEPGQAAVPWYVGRQFDDAPPGHRYLSYLPFWKSNWSAINEGKQKVLKDVGGLSNHASALMRQLAARQAYLGQSSRAEVIAAECTSPFATGLGWEHPNENGFAFLQPYGLPYLAGSGVKGVVRRAAEELALFGNGAAPPGTEPWTMLDVWWLFGFEGAAGAIWGPNGDWAAAFDEHKPKLLERGDLTEFLGRIKDGDKALSLNDLAVRRRDLSFSGSLRFWDVIPELSGMDVDIMNPHYGSYYQGNSTPHDAGSPIPIFFLVIPPGSKFTFVVDCPRERYLPMQVSGRWRNLLRVAFEHAFEWLGFGAKTAVGYGAMSPVSKRADQAPVSGRTEGREAVEPTRVPSQAASDTRQEEWEKATITWQPGPKVVVAAKPGEKPAEARGKDADEFLKKLTDEQQTRLMKRKQLGNVTVVVEIYGNQRTLKGVK